MLDTGSWELDEHSESNLTRKIGSILKDSEVRPDFKVAASHVSKKIAGRSSSPSYFPASIARHSLDCT